MYILIWLTVAVAVFVLWIRNKFSYFIKLGVKQQKGWDMIKSAYRTFSGKDHATISISDAYHYYPDEKFVGNYEMFSTPIIFIRDPELIRKVGVKDFDHFMDHRNMLNQEDFVFSKSLISLQGQKWRDMRATLSPAFTGSKLRNMVPLIQDCCKGLLDDLERQINETNEKYVDIDTQDLLTRFTNDVIASTAFGLQINSVKDKDNQFYLMGKKITNFSLKQVLRMLVLLLVPFLTKLVKINIFPADAVKFLTQIVTQTLNDRDEKKIYRPDMIQLLLEVRKGTLQHEDVKDEKDAGFATVEESAIGKGAIKQVWDDDYLVAQALLFFFAGFETVSTCLKFVLAELAINSDIQDQLRQEIDEHHERYDGKIEFDKINQMKYMDMVVSGKENISSIDSNKNMNDD